MCSVSSAECCVPPDPPSFKIEPASPFYRHKEGAVYTYRREEKSSSFPRVAGVQWSSTIESTLWSMAPGMAVVLGLAEIALVS